MKIIVKTPGVYNDAKNKGQYCTAGEELETKEWYGKSLITAGLATAIVKVKAEKESRIVETAIPVEAEKAAPPVETIPEYPADSKTEILEVEKTLAGKKAKA